MEGAGILAGRRREISKELQWKSVIHIVRTDLRANGNLCHNGSLLLVTRAGHLLNDEPLSIRHRKYVADRTAQARRRSCANTKHLLQRLASPVVHIARQDRR